jgi:hypothetical protein
MLAAFLPFDVLTLLLTAGVIALIISTVIMVLDLMPSRKPGRWAGSRDSSDLSPAAARVLAAARRKAEVANSDAVGVVAVSNNPQLIDERPIPVTLQMAPSPVHDNTIVIEASATPTGALRPAPTTPSKPELKALPPAPAHAKPGSFEDAMALVAHYAEVDPGRVADVIHQWLRSDERLYEEDIT